ncbi:hypothetical protein EV191_107105 [Tamaricihabitans halophyticus]|uniref:Uncharacterized protein n=1 Tax=Tamaricihabitans halophyticus TaxID=1262583 RepID=A0A4R2QUY4_9PSEU|nr:hypothetical protein [Tamaricihabitans halophyticus]TCP50841.1 hypothetical protein EV191_107105 [Tamaricihabitans halophyticus]
MGQLAERLNGIRVHAAAPGIDLEGELRNRTEITLSFGESVYEFVNEAALERALASLARLLYTGWLRQYREAISTTNLNIYPNDQHDFNFRDEADAVEASGESSDRRITLSTVGMRSFSAEIQRGTVRELSERGFIANIAEAAPRLIEDYRAKVTDIKRRYYG